MKRLFILFTIISLAMQTNSMAQATANFTASVTIIEPIGITTTSNMNFANIDAQQGGAVTLTPNNTRISSGGVKLADSNSATAATFKVTGESGYTFSISLPETEQVLTNGNENMIIKDFTTNFNNAANLDNGVAIIKVGATLNVNARQTPGIYTSPAPMQVTVNYN